MPPEPTVKRAIAFVDGQNLYHAAKAAFGHTFPSYDIHALSRAICASRGWAHSQTRFYTGIPDALDSPRWSHFWTAKMAVMGRQGVHVFSRPLRYRDHRVPLPGGGEHTIRVGEEKGIDVRIAIDAIRQAHLNEYDVALIFSQDQDLSEVAEEIRVIAREQGRWIKVASAYPVSPTSRNRRGINKTDWIPIDQATYDVCLDPRDYRPKPPTP